MSFSFNIFFYLIFHVLDEFYMFSFNRFYTLEGFFIIYFSVSSVFNILLKYSMLNNLLSLFISFKSVYLNKLHGLHSP